MIPHVRNGISSFLRATAIPPVLSLSRQAFLSTADVRRFFAIGRIHYGGKFRSFPESRLLLTIIGTCLHWLHLHDYALIGRPQGTNGCTASIHLFRLLLL